MCLDTRSALLLVVFALPLSAHAGSQTQVNFDSGTQAMYNFGGTLLNPGTAADGDGAVIQLGYYDGGTASSPFTGTWHALTGQGSLNTGGDTGSGLAFNTTSIGDIGGGAAPGGSGVFGFSLLFDSAIAGTFNDLPGATTIPLAIRFYNGTTLGTSTYYNTVSNAAWLWQTPVNPSPLPPIINLSFDDVGLQWESIALGQSAATAFHTTIVPVPEPDSLYHALPCLAALGWRRRRGGRVTPSL
jgi:hypothetical protein